MTPSMCILSLIAICVWLDARSRNAKNALLWAVGSWLLSIAVVPLYLATRPLKEGEIREGGVVWNVCRSLALVWTIVVTVVLLCGGIDYDKLGSGEYGGIAKGAFFLIAGGVWFGVIVVALVIGMFGKNSSIVERGAAIVRKGSTTSDLQLLAIIITGVLAVGALVQGGSWLIEKIGSGVETIKQAWNNRDPVYLYPVQGADETVVNVAAGPQDPPGAQLGMRHPLPGTKVQVIGEGPGNDGKTKQIRILEGEFSGLEGWAFTECLQNQRVAATPAHKIDGAGTTKWSFQTNGEIECSPLIHNGTVYVGSGDGNLYAINAVTGAERWHFQANAGIDAGVAASDGKVFCGSKNGILYAIQESDGHLAWKYEPPQVSDMSAIFTTPLVSGGKVYFGSLTGYVRALDELTGSQIWAFKASDMEANSSPVMSNQTIYFGGRHDYLYAVDAATGMERWRSVNINGTINDAPLLDGGSVIFTVTEYDPTGGSIYAMEAMTGLQQWRFQTFNERSGDFGPLVVGNRVFCTASGIGEKRDENYMYALNRKTGQMVWKRRIPKAMTSLALYKSGLVFGSTDGLYIVSVTDGSLQFYEKTGEIQMSKPAIVGSTAYVGSNDHNLYAVTLPNILTTSPLAASYPMVNTAIAVGTGGSSTIGTGGRTSGSLGVGRSTPDPAIFELQQENNQLADQIKTLQLKNVNSHNDIQRLNKELIETRESIAERDAAMARLQNTLRLTDETSHSKDETVEDMRKTLERWKIHNSSDNSPPLESPKVSTVDEQPGKC